METETPDDVLSMALDIEEAIAAQSAGPSIGNTEVKSVSNVVEIHEQRANFNLEVPVFDWQSMLAAMKPTVNISNCQVTLNMGN